jgi:uncharacterized LabA/DUF88 family protein
LVAQGTLLIATTEPAVLVIASGDRDFLPLVSVAHELKWTVEMAGFSYSMSTQMLASVDKVRRLDDAIHTVGHCV